MKLIVFHKVLIWSAILFAFGYGIYEVYVYIFPQTSPATEELLGVLAETPEREPGALWTGVLMLIGGAALGVYLAWVYRTTREPAPDAKSAAYRP